MRRSFHLLPRCRCARWRRRGMLSQLFGDAESLPPDLRRYSALRGGCACIRECPSSWQSAARLVRPPMAAEACSAHCRLIRLPRRPILPEPKGSYLHSSSATADIVIDATRIRKYRFHMGSLLGFSRSTTSTYATHVSVDPTPNEVEILRDARTTRRGIGFPDEDRLSDQVKGRDRAIRSCAQRGPSSDRPPAEVSESCAPFTLSLFIARHTSSCSALCWARRRS